MSTCTTTKKDGTPCPNKPVKGLDVCFGHSPEQKAAAKRASDASVKARQARVQAGKAAFQAEVDAHIGLQTRLRREVAEHQDEIARALRERAVSDPSSRAMAMLLERVLGAVPQSLEVSTDVTDPNEMDASQIAA